MPQLVGKRGGTVKMKEIIIQYLLFKLKDGKYKKIILKYDGCVNGLKISRFLFSSSIYKIAQQRQIPRRTGGAWKWESAK